MKLLRSLRVGTPLLALVLAVLWFRLNHETSPRTTNPQPPAERRTLAASPETGRPAVPAFENWRTRFETTNDPALIPTGVALAKERRKHLKRLIETNPAGAIRQSLTRAQRERLPDEILEHLETPVSAAGEFEMIVACYLNGLRRPANQPEVQRFVTIGDERYRAFTFGRRAEMQTKDRISIHGIAIDDALALHSNPVKEIDSTTIEVFGKVRRFAGEDEREHFVAALLAYEDAAGPGATGGDDDDLPVANSAWTEGAKRILYLRVRFADDDPAYEPVTLATAMSHQDDVAEHYKASSYGKTTITTVFPDMITLSQNKSAYVGQGLGLMMNEARDLARDMGIAQGEDWDYNNYDFYTIISDGGIGGYAGVAQVGGRKSHHQRGYTSLRTSGHEFGHNFGLSHAYFNLTPDLNPRSSTPLDGLGRAEYGHRFSVMSAQSGSDMDHPLIPHFTVHEKWRLDWLTDADFTDITSGNQSGTYRLYQNDEENATGLRALRVPSGGLLSKYWLSYRTAWRTPNRGSDNDYLLNGIVFDWTGSGGGTSTLLDMTPYSDDSPTGGSDWTRDNSDKWDAPLLIGRTYTDPDSQLSVTPVARGGSAPDEYIDVHVHLATGAENNLVNETDPCKAVVPDANTANGTDWTGISFDDSSWPYSGALGVGYDENNDYQQFFGIDVESAMNNSHPTCYIRIPFTIDGSVNLAEITGLKLGLRYDDGFVAYINGVKIAEDNAPANPAWDSEATDDHSDSSAVNFVDFSGSAAVGALVNGTNVLAIHGMNGGDSSSDFLIQPRLSAVLLASPNASPSVNLSADILVAGINQDVTLTAAGSDPDGDTLAYAWDFDIGDTFAPEGLNSPVAVRSWSNAGLYAVTVTCSDMKGGIARDRVLIQVGNPSSEGIIKGRVLRGGESVAGARVFIDGTDTQSITLDDGSYLFAGVSSSSKTIGAMLDGEVFQPVVPMPVAPDPLAEGVDFLAHSTQPSGAPAQVLTISPPGTSTTVTNDVPLSAALWDNTLAEDLIIPFGDTWLYLDTGVDPGAGWMDPAFDDSAWLAGPAELGYGDTQATVISYGTDSNNKHITSWFRRSVTVTNISEVSRLKLSVKRDDGIRVFLNGTEIVRDNLTTGTVSAGTEARNDVSSTYENVLLHYNVDPALLVEGENVIAAEVHQESDDSSDVSFDLQLSAARNLSDITPVWSVLPAGATVSAAGVFNAGTPGTYTVTATSGALQAQSVISVASDNVVSIEALDAFLWENGAATSTIRVSRTGDTSGTLIVPLTFGGDATAGGDYAMPPSSVTIAAGETFAEFVITPADDSIQEGREWILISPQSGSVYSLGSPAVASLALIDDENPVLPEPEAGDDASVYVNDTLSLAGTVTGAEFFVEAGDYWKFDDSGNDLGAGWIPLLFGDSLWNEGLAKFGYGDGDETTTVSFGGNSSDKQITTYFRRRFYLDDPADYDSLKARLLLDDGAVVYINGIEALRVNLPGGQIDYSTRAQSAVGGSDEDTFFEWELDPADLTAGENIVAVEVHQASSGSSDLGFDMSLHGGGLAAPGHTVLWEKTSGPGNALFSDSTAAVSGVSFDQSGDYTLQLTVNHNGETFSDQINVTVNPVPAFADWIGTFSPGDSSPLGDPDKDNQSNLMEFATGTDPSSPGSRAQPALVRDPATPAELLFTYRRLAALDPSHAVGTTGDGYTLYGISYTVEAATDIQGWSPAAGVLTLQEESVKDNRDGTETVTVRLIPPAGNDARWFVRLSVSAE